MALSPRFQLDDILGNEVVDFQVLQSNYDKLDVAAANTGLANSYSNVQTIHRAALTDVALQVRLDADSTARMTVTADGVISWAGGSIGPGAGGTLAINATSVTLGSIKAGAGTAAAPSYSFSTDPDTGLYSPSGDILGVAVGGVEVNRINNQGEIRFNRTNARIGVGTGDDPNTPGERLVLINALQVNPGRIHASGGLNANTLQVNTTSVFTGAVTMSSTLTVASTLQTSGAINAWGGRINFESSNQVYIQWRGDLGALFIPYGNGIYVQGGTSTFTGNLSVSGTSYHGRIVSGSWDVGWTNNFGGSTIAQGRFYQRANGGYYCYDAGDFAYSSGVYGNYMVQRNPNGYIYANYVNMTADVAGGKPTHVAGMNGDNFLRWWPIAAIGPPDAVVGIGVGNTWYASGGNWVAGTALTLPRTGHWIVFFKGRYDVPGDPGPMSYRLLINGNLAEQYQDDAVVGEGGRQFWGCCLSWQSFAGAGTWCRVDVLLDTNFQNQQRVTGTLYAYFLSTAPYPN